LLLAAHERLIIKRYIVPRGGERIIVLVASISLAAVTLGVAALVIVASVMNGYHQFIFDKVVQTTGHAVVRGDSGRLPDWPRVAETARATPGVTSASPLVEQRLMASTAGRVVPARLRGVVPSEIASPAFRESLVAGRLDLDPSGGEVVIGSELASMLPTAVGATIELVIVEGQGEDLDVRSVSYRVAGVVETGAPDFDSEAVLMPIGEAQTLLGLGNAVTSLSVTTADAVRADLILAPLSGRLGPGVTLRTWKTLNAELFTALAVDKIGMFIVLAIIILVAVFNILSALVMLVRAKTGDIAILRTMGASRASMLRIFITLGSAIGALGTVGGLAMGLLFLQFRGPIGVAIQVVTRPSTEAASDFLVKLPAVIDPVEIGVIAVAALLLSVLATLYPALRAARTDPVRVLKHG
jgi:lipoprotein-releasing system permease protein